MRKSFFVKLSFVLLLVIQLFIAAAPFYQRTDTLQNGTQVVLRVDQAAPIVSTQTNGLVLSYPDLILRAPNARALAELSAGQAIYLVLNTEGTYATLSSYRTSAATLQGELYLTATVTGTSRVTQEEPVPDSNATTTRVEYLIQCSIPAAFLPCSPAKIKSLQTLLQSGTQEPLWTTVKIRGGLAVCEELYISDRVAG